jgi:putative ABC transport system permease protein
MSGMFKSLLSRLANLVSILSIVVKRLNHHRGVTFSSAVGVISVLSMIICVPIFTSAVLSQVLMQTLVDKAASNNRSLFSIHAYYYDDTIYFPLTIQGAGVVSQWINNQLTDSMGVKVSKIVTTMMTEAYGWAPIKYKSSKPPFESVFISLATDNFAQEKTKIVEGTWPSTDYLSNPTGPIPVAIEEEFADNNFLNVGDIYQAVNADSPIQMQVVGIFRAIDPSDKSWFYSPRTTYEKEAWVPMEFFQKLLPGLIKRPSHFTSWYAIADDPSLRFHNSLQISQAMTHLDAGFHQLLNEVKIDYSPAEELKSYETRMTTMITLFYVAGAPLILLALLFISLTASIALQQQDQEITTMRGRGVSYAHIIFLNLVESVVLIAVSIPFALLLGWLLANLMGHTQLFLQFNRASNFSFSIGDINLLWIGVIALVVIAARLVPLFGLRHTTAVNIRQERSRSGKKPVWERIFLDFILLIPAAYAYLIMRGKVQPVKLLSNLNLGGGSGQSDPLMFLASSLFAIAACMIALRAFPLLMRLVASFSNRHSRVGTYLAVQEISRRPQDHTSVMLLIMISLSLAIFSASIAKTLDQWMHDSQYYQVGADLAVREYEIPVSGNPANGGGTTTDQVSKGILALVSLESHLSLPGIQSATYVGKYDGQCTYSSTKENCTLLGLDRLSFPTATFFRNDFSNQPLGALMNALALNPLGVIVPQDLLKTSGLRVGDQLNVTSSVGVIDQGFNQNMVIVGSYLYFPTVYPDQNMTVIVNLGAIFGTPEEATNYDVWLNVRNKADYQTVLDQMQGVAGQQRLLIDVRGNAIQQIQQLLSQPEWVGLFGILSVGFLLTGLMACIGFVLDTFASLQKHYIQLGIFQAIGLSMRQLVSYLVLERVILMAVTLGCGTVIGFLTSVLFLPILQISAAPGTPVPPFQVLIGWVQSAWLILLFGLVLLGVIVATIGYLVQIKIFQAVKMGETI